MPYQVKTNSDSYLLFFYFRTINFKTPMNGVQLHPPPVFYDVRSNSRPLDVNQVKEEIRLSRQLLESSINRRNQVLTTKKSEGTISFGEDQEKNPITFSPPIHRRLNFQVSSPLQDDHHVQRISFSYQSPERKGTQNMVNEHLEKTNETNHNFSLETLRKKAGIQNENKRNTYDLDRRYTTEVREFAPSKEMEKTFVSYERKKHDEQECVLCKKYQRDRYHIADRRQSPRKYQRYSNSQLHSGTLVDSGYRHSTPTKVTVKDPIVIESNCKFQREGKYCQLCNITRSHMRQLQKLNSSSLRSKTYAQEQFDTVQPQTKVDKINESSYRYFADKYLKESFLYKLEEKPTPKKVVVNPEKRQTLSHQKRKDPRLCYSITGPIKRENSPKRNTGMSFSKERSRTMVESNEKVGGGLHHSKTNHPYMIQKSPKEKTYGNIHGYKSHNRSSSGTPNKIVNFGWVRESLEGKTSNPKSNMYRNKSRQLYEQNRSLIPGLRLYELEAESRRWYEAHLRGIEYQIGLIHSYDLIRRFMREQEINERLQDYVVKMIEPKHWLSLMVDQVYDKLKDKYRSEYY